MSVTTEAQYVQIAILRSSVTLQYERTCTWSFSLTVENVEQEQVIAEGPEVTIEREFLNDINHISCLCRANETLLLNATFTLYGELKLMLLL